MAEVELGYTELHVFLNNLKLNKKALPHSEKEISGFSNKRYVQPELLSDTYDLKGGVKLGFTKQGLLNITGGHDKAVVAKKNLDDFIAGNELSDEEAKMYKYLSAQLGAYIERLEKRRRDRDERDPDKDPDKKPEDKKPEDKKPEDKKPEDKKPEDKKPEDKKPEDKKPEDKKPEDKKPDQDPEKDPNIDPNKKGSNKMDLKNINSLEDVKKQMEALAEEAKKIRKTEELAKAAQEIEFHKRRIEAYKSELENLDTKHMDVVEENRTKGTIKELIKEEEEALEKAIKAEEELQKSVRADEIKKAEGKLRDEKSAFYTQAQMKFDNEIRKIKHEMEGILISLNEFQYEYQEGTRIPTNGDAVRNLNDQYRGLQTKLADLQAAKALCAEQKALVQAEYEQAVAAINEIISRKDKQPEVKPEDKKPEDKKPEDKKPEDKKPEDKKPEDRKPDEEEYDDMFPQINAKAFYAGLNFYDRYLMKVAAFAHENPEDLNENGKPSLLQRVRLMLPSSKYKAKAERGLKFGYLEPEKILGYDPYDDYEDEEIDDDIEFEEIDEKDEGAFARYRARTPDPKKKTPYRGRYERDDEEQK